MSDIAIQVESVSKLYQIGKRKTYRTARESLMNVLTAPARLFGSKKEDPETDLWALRDVSFQVKQGEVVGIIGRNGAGKSTLLKVLSRITEPTTGRIVLKGRVGSLLEVGTGFHPELTGRENIYLNGAILGMRRNEIARNFDAIVDFSEVEKFLDTPVKHYSSGMYTRLAFAVAAHLEPEILIVDEVLAVGDAAFQKKCLGKMQDVAGHGRTVLFVSHNMAAIRSLCTSCYLFRGGLLSNRGPTESVTQAYLDSFEQSSSQALETRTDRGGSGQTRLIGMTMETGSGSLHPATGQEAVIKMTFNRPTTAHLLLGLYTQSGLLVSALDSRVPSPCDAIARDPSDSLRCRIETLLLAPGKYRINAAVYENGVVQDHLEGALFFEVRSGTVSGRHIDEHTVGTTVLPHRWESLAAVELNESTNHESR